MNEFNFKKPLGSSYTKKISSYYWDGKNLDVYIVNNMNEVESYGDKPCIISMEYPCRANRIEWGFANFDHRFYGPASIELQVICNNFFIVGKKIFYCYDDLILKHPRFTKEIIGVKSIWGQTMYKKQIKTLDDWFNFDRV